ncbi:MAG TPA: tetratricopeptide repeat protein [Gemmatimonadales bacterium]|nr:tetratricopeptide repeat protein [Gemmatimonadales bacterium]
MRRTALAFVLAAAAARPAAAQTIQDHIHLGVQAVDQRDLHSARQHFEAALAMDSMNYEANWRGSDNLVDIGKETPDTVKSPARDSMYAMAERWARRAVATDPNGADGHFALAQAIGRASLTLGKKERVKRAKEIRDEALRAVELDPRHDGAYHVLGRWNAEIMRLSGIQRFFAKSFLGGAVFNQASWPNAIQYMERAVSLRPDYIYHHLDLAEMYIDLERWADARTQLNLVETLPVIDAADPHYKTEAQRLLASIQNRR